MEYEGKLLTTRRKERKKREKQEIKNYSNEGKKETVV
jgi:hypothetical protein